MYRGKTTPYSSNLASQSTLWKAWRVVQANGLSSKSARTRDAVRAFSSIVDTQIRSIGHNLSRRKYEFAKATGVPIARPGKPSRPIVSYELRDRIVQRALLDCLLEIQSLAPLYLNPGSFGGLPKLGVRDAWKSVFAAIEGGATHYVRSDIKNFFTHIPRSSVLAKIQSALQTPDDYFCEVLDRALKLELSNLEQLGREAELFPLHEIGVAQGCCLSPFFGNVLLGEFDRQVNSNGIVCIRYIDDFIILTNSHKKARRATALALSILSDLGLEAYDPVVSPDKAQFGLVRDGISLLGCDFHPGILGPAKKTRRRLMDSIKEALDISETYMDRPRTSAKFKKGLLDAFSQIDHILEGWGNQYAFCNNIDIMRALDADLDKMIANYLRKYRQAIFEAGNDFTIRRRLLGLHLLTDSKHAPLQVPHI